MTSGRPLHELLADLVGDADAARAHGDPETYLAANGHPDLPPDLVAEAVVSYADTAPVDVAEHLAPYVTTHSAVPTSEPPAEDWFGLITTAPAEDLPDEDLSDGPGFADDLSGGQPWSQDHDHASALDFGAGSEGVDSPHHATADTAADSPEDDAQDATDEQAEQSAWTDLEPETAGLDDLDDQDGDLDDDPDDI
jgi:hypothetical protein